jgi:hypothetical protein
MRRLSPRVRLSEPRHGEGNFSLPDAPSGYYKVWADLPPFRMDEQAILQVGEAGCGYTDIQLAATSTLLGVVRDHLRTPAPKIPVRVQLKDWRSEDGNYALSAETDADGRFTITGVRDMDAYLSAGNDYPTTDVPYERVYYPKGRSAQGAALLRLKPGEHAGPMVLRLEAAPEKAGVRVRVVHKGGGPEVDTSVSAFSDSGLIVESARVDAHGAAEIPCLRGVKYELEAYTLRSRRAPPGEHPHQFWNAVYLRRFECNA